MRIFSANGCVEREMFRPFGKHVLNRIHTVDPEVILNYLFRFSKDTT